MMTRCRAEPKRIAAGYRYFHVAMMAAPSASRIVLTWYLGGRHAILFAARQSLAHYACWLINSFGWAFEDIYGGIHAWSVDVYSTYSMSPRSALAAVRKLVESRRSANTCTGALHVICYQSSALRPTTGKAFFLAIQVVFSQSGAFSPLLVAGAP